MPLDYQILKVSAYGECLCTIIKNVSTSPLFVLIPWHGTTLGAGEQIAFIGGLDNWLQRKRYRTRDSFIDAMKNGKLSLLQLPLPTSTFKNAGTDVTKTINVVQDTGTTGKINIGDPCWKPT